MVIRHGRPDDASALLRFWADSAHGRSVSDDLEGVQRLLAHDPAAVLIAEEQAAGEQAAGERAAGESGAGEPGAGRGPAIVGTLVAGWDGWRCHLYRLAVAPGRRRRGVGRALLAAAELRFAALGGRRCDAMVLDDNAEAHALYLAAGYQRQPEWSRWIRSLDGHPS